MTDQFRKMSLFLNGRRRRIFFERNALYSDCFSIPLEHNVGGFAFGMDKLFVLFMNTPSLER